MRFVICQQDLYRFGKDREAFLDRIITTHEASIHHCEPDNKQHSME
jgi:hypothetical protein